MVSLDETHQRDPRCNRLRRSTLPRYLRDLGVLEAHGEVGVAPRHVLNRIEVERITLDHLNSMLGRD